MLRILIAEDEPLEQQSLKDILEWNFSCGVDIKTASNGVDAISTATIWHADLVLMDIEMPGCNGIVAANKIAKVNPLTKFIIITAYERFEYAHEAVRLHAVDYLLKPVEDAVLVSTIPKIDSRAGGGKCTPAACSGGAGTLPGTDIPDPKRTAHQKCGRLYPEKLPI